MLKAHIINSGTNSFQGFNKENPFKLVIFDVGNPGVMCELPSKVILEYSYGTYKGFFCREFCDSRAFWLGPRASLVGRKINMNMNFSFKLMGPRYPLKLRQECYEIKKSKSFCRKV